MSREYPSLEQLNPSVLRCCGETLTRHIAADALDPHRYFEEYYLAELRSCADADLPVLLTDLLGMVTDLRPVTRTTLLAELAVLGLTVPLPDL